MGWLEMSETDQEHEELHHSCQQKEGKDHPLTEGVNGSDEETPLTEGVNGSDGETSRNCDNV